MGYYGSLSIINLTNNPVLKLKGRVTDSHCLELIYVQLNRGRR